MIDRTVAEDLIYRIANAGIRYYLTKADEEPGYDIDEDIDYCLEPMRGIPRIFQDSMRERIREVIVDPTRYRAAIVGDITALASG